MASYYAEIIDDTSAHCGCNHVPRIAAGIIVTSGNNPLPTLEAEFQPLGFGYAGADLYDGGYLTGQAMVAAGLEPGDKALVYDIWHNEGRSVSSQGLYDALEEAGQRVEKRVAVISGVEPDPRRGESGRQVCDHEMVVALVFVPDRIR